MKFLNQLMSVVAVAVMAGAGEHLNFMLGTTWTVPLFSFGILLAIVSVARTLKSRIDDLEKKISELRR
jgi:hypothetical protein